jgi:hypothetical protein
MKQLWEFGYCLRLLRAQMRFGDRSRAPLRFLHIEVRDVVARCDWIARAPDPWDTDLPVPAQERRASAQALEDALLLPELLFLALPNVRTAELRAFRETAGPFPELILEGSITAAARSSDRASSIAMRALLAGFRFRLEDGILRALEVSEPAFERVT